jgi:hypothetical protein
VQTPSGRLYRAVDLNVQNKTRLHVALVTADGTACADLTAPACWTLGKGLAWDPSWIPAAAPSASRHWEEPGAVLGPRGKVNVLVRIDAPLHGCATVEECNRAALLELNPVSGALELSRLVPLPTGCNKFAIRRDDDADGSYYALTNPVSQLPAATYGCGQRNRVILARSRDLVRWDSCAVVMWDDLGLGVAESIRQTGLQYIDWRFDGPDIVAAVRAGYNGSTTYHDASRLLLSTIRDYRGMCGGPIATGTGFLLGVLQNGLSAWTNREYVWGGVPAEMAGLMFTHKVRTCCSCAVRSTQYAVRSTQYAVTCRASW